MALRLERDRQVRKEGVMSEQHVLLPRPLPRVFIWVASALVSLHFLAILMLVLAAQSGPWPTPDPVFDATGSRESPVEGPYFATLITNVTMPCYLQPLRMTHNYHFQSNRLNLSHVYFEARLKDDQGKVTTLTFPDQTQNPWMRHRQSLLAQALGDDMPVQVPRGEFIPAPGQKMPMLTIWDGAPKTVLKLREVPQHLVAKDRPVFRPSEWSLLLARSYARYLRQEYGAASVELIRHSKETVVPAMMFQAETPPGTFDELVCSFGE
jgi:hypothetical protein